jgi:hypothetical protein
VREADPKPTFVDGSLSPGDYELSLAQLKQSILVEGLPGLEPWDRPWRASLVDELSYLVKQLWQVGIADIYVDGSFVSDKAQPGDIDGYFHCDAFRLHEVAGRLNQIHPHHVWLWVAASRTPDDHGDFKLPMWHRHRVELWPHPAACGGWDPSTRKSMMFPEFFRKDRAGNPRGIIKIRGPE